MTGDRKKPPGRINPVNNRSSNVSRIVKRTTLRDKLKDTTEPSLDEQVAALKKIPADRIGTNELEIKAAETAARLQEALSENVRLSSVVESVRKETVKYRQLYEKAVEDIKHAIDARNESKNQTLKAESMIEELQSEIQTLRKELYQNIRTEKRMEYIRIKPDQMAEMISGFEQTLSDSLTGLMLSNIELRLKVAVDAEDDGPILVLPPLSKGKIRSDRINEIIVRVLPSGVIRIP